jgi:hypothetical protein
VWQGEERECGLLAVENVEGRLEMKKGKGDKDERSENCEGRAAFKKERKAGRRALR